MQNEIIDLFENSLPALRALFENPEATPYLDRFGLKINKEALEKLEQETEDRKNFRLVRERYEAAKKREQELCPHLSGCLGEISSQHTSIVWHQLNSEDIVGICITCGRQFWPTDTDYWEWRRKPSFNRMSGAGRKPAPLGYEAPISEEDRNTYLQDELFAMLDKERDSQSGYAYPAEGLDALSDEQIKFLMDGVREYRKALKDPKKYLEEEFSKPERSV